MLTRDHSGFWIESGLWGRREGRHRVKRSNIVIIWTIEGAEK